MPRTGAKPRTLVLCFDGTTNIFDETNTNVVKLFSLLKHDNREEQMVYYQPGVRTYVPPGMLLPITLKLAKVADQGIALYLDKHVMGGYEFLMKHYNEGDKICLFGFSRGAYTARALAGMLHKVGLLPPDNAEQIPFAYSTYIRSDKAGFKESAGFKEAFCRKVEIEFMGVWDTVSSVGLLIPRQLPFTRSNPIVKTFRHAVSLDERRAKFKDHLWHVHSPGGHRAKTPEGKQSTKAVELLSPIAETSPSIVVSRLFPNLPESNLNFATDGGTPSTDCETTPDTATGPPLWARGHANGISPVGTYEQTQVAPPNDVWHSHEQTHVEVREPSPEGEKPKHLDTSVTLEREAVASAVNAAKNRRLDRITGWLSFPRAPRQCSTDSCGETKYEMNMQHRTDKGNNDRETDVLEVWFAGCHSDVGGGAEKDTEERQLSNISLRWMIRQIALSQCGIKFDTATPKATHIFPEIVRSGIGAAGSCSDFESVENQSTQSDLELVDTTQELDNNDALAKLHDNLRNPGWWLLEFIPLFRASRDEEGNRRIKIRCNLFKGRRPDTFSGKIKVHRTVQYRMTHSPTEAKYGYKARIGANSIEWVD